MLWSEQTQLLETVFTMRCKESIPHGFASLSIKASRACRGERRVLRIHDVTEDSRYIRCDTGVAARSELVVPLLMQDRLIGVLDLESTDRTAFTLRA